MSKAKNLEEKIKKLEADMAKKKADLLRAKGKLSETERKARTRRLIQIGGLADIAGISELDQGTILGGLIHLADKLKSDATLKEFKALGDKVLAERAKESKNYKYAVTG